MIYLDVAGHGPGLIPPQQGFVPVGDRGLLYGDGLFETVLVRDGTIPLLSLHLERLSASAAALALPLDREHVQQAAEAVAGAAGRGEYALRITLSRGSAARRGYEPPPDAAPTLLVTSSPYRRPVGPLSAITAAVRVNPSSPLTQHKSLSALEKVLARADAARAGADEALLLNLRGRVAEGATSNLFLRRGGKWFTPPLSEGCLAGVMRRRVRALSGAVEEPVAPRDLLNADGVYLTNSLMGCLPLVRLDGQPLPFCESAPFAADVFTLS